MPLLSFDFTPTYARYCQRCGRMEIPQQVNCPKCGTKLQRCSRYEWFLADELRKALDAKKVEYLFKEQSPLESPFGFSWHYDIYVWVVGDNPYGGYGELVEVSMPNHDRRHWNAYVIHGLYEYGIGYRVVFNDRCKKKNAPETAKNIAKELIERANDWLWEPLGI